MGRDLSLIFERESSKGGVLGARRTNIVANQIHQQYHHKTLIENPHILVVSLHTLTGMQHCHSFLPEIDAATISCNGSQT